MWFLQLQGFDPLDPARGRPTLDENPGSRRVSAGRKVYFFLVLRAVDAGVAAERLALGVGVADAEAKDGQSNQDHGLHRGSPIYCQGETVPASMQA